ncbi:MAG: 6-carboxytetrahydropterin synthase QueD [Candidatus Omnitrophota bacterium]
MYEVLVRSDFSGAHNLEGYLGKCEELHGHNWKVEARFTSEKLNEIGLCEDFKILKEKLKAILENLDHTYLNKIEFFQDNNPSAENIAKYIYDGLKIVTTRKDFSVKSVSVWESDTSCATYYE